MTDAPRATSCACEVCEVAREARRLQEVALAEAYARTFAGQMEELRLSLAQLVAPVVDALSRLTRYLERKLP